ncbi:polysaccharide biosynthesis C-terminal domain-containing protein [Oscillospiraceae bacterium WX1]
MKRENKYIKLLSDTVVFAVGNLLVKIVQLLLLPLYTVTLTTAAYGTAELINNLTEMLLPVVTICIYEATFRFAVERDIEHSKLLTDSLRVLFLGILVFTALTGVLQAFIHSPYTWLSYLIIVTYAVRMVLAGFVRGIGHVRRFAAGGVVNVAALFGANIILLIYCRMGAAGYLMSLTISNIVSTLFIIISSGLHRYIVFEKWDPKLVKTILTFSFPMVFNVMSWWLTNMSGRYIILWSCGVATAGLYAAASKLPAVINLAAGTFQQAWQASSAREHKSADGRLFFSNIFKVYSALVLLFGAAVILATPILARLMLKGDFYAAMAYLPLLMVTAMLNCYSTYFGTLYNAFKNNKMVMVSTIAGAAVNIAAGALLVHVIGVWGPLASGVFCYLIVVIIRMADTMRLVSVEKELKLNLPCFALIVAESIFMSIGGRAMTALSAGIAGVVLFCHIYYYRKPLRVARIRLEAKINSLPHRSA